MEGPQALLPRLLDAPLPPARLPPAPLEQLDLRSRLSERDPSLAIPPGGRTAYRCAGEGSNCAGGPVVMEGAEVQGVWRSGGGGRR